MWHNIKNDFAFLTVIAKPNAKRTQILEVLPDGIKIALHAVPEDGKANKELTDFLSETFAVSKKEIAIIRGENNKLKLVKIRLSKELQTFINSNVE